MATQIQSANGATRRSRRATGFTTIELVVTIIVIGIIGVVIMPRMDLIGGFDQSGFRDQLQSSLEYARKAAIAARRCVCVTTSGSATSGTTVSFAIDTREPDTPAVAFTSVAACAAGGTYTAALSLPTSGQMGAGPGSIKAPGTTGVTISPALTFDAIGRPVNPASATLAPLAGDVSVSVTGGATALVLTVAAETGLVH